MTMTYVSEAAAAWAEAVSTHTVLAAGGSLRPIPSPHPDIASDPREQVLAVFDSGLTYARFSSATPPPVHGGSQVILGSAPFLAGFLAVHTAKKIRSRQQLERYCARQWRTSPLRTTVLTTHRLWAELPQPATPSIWRRLNYDTISHMQLSPGGLVVEYVDADPLNLGGPWAPWCAAVIAHYRYGRQASAAVPMLAAAVPS